LQLGSTFTLPKALTFRLISHLAQIASVRVSPIRIFPIRIFPIRIFRILRMGCKFRDSVSILPVVSAAVMFPFCGRQKQARTRGGARYDQYRGWIRIWRRKRRGTGGFVDLWTTRVDKHFRDRAPRVESRANGDYYLIDGFEPIPVRLERVAIDDKIAGKIKSAQGYRHAATRPGAWNPEARLVDQDLDHVRAEVLYPGLGPFITSAPDPVYVRACYQAYNEC
jgi:hypothetical protein